MPDVRPLRPDGLDGLTDLVEQQAGVVARVQVLDTGGSEAHISTQVRAGRWQRLLPGCYLTHTGPVPGLAAVWAGILYAGKGALASHGTAAQLAGLRDEHPPVVHVTVPADRRVAPQPGLVIHISLRAAAHRHPVRLPPQTRVEETVLDLVEATRRSDEVVALITAAVQRRLTHPELLARAAAGRKKLHWRQLVEDVVADAADGVHSALERRYVHDVERAHGLPPGRRNAGEGWPGRRRYRDVRYDELDLVVELDGQVAHPADLRHRDMRRDNEVVEGGRASLRYGWADVASNPCRVAAQVVRVARQRGWLGAPRRCGPACWLDLRLDLR